MALTFLEMQDEVLDTIDADDTTTRSHVKNYINRSAKDVWVAHPWRERRKEKTFVTAAPYSTGTVSISNGSATVTGSGTTFPTTYTATLFRFATGYGANFYPVTSRDSATSLTLTDNFYETTLSGSTYVLWQDIYRLHSEVDTLIEMRLQYPGFDGPMAVTTEARLDEVVYHPDRADKPTVWAMTANSSTGLKQVRLWPVPDNTYRIVYRYLAVYTDMSADEDECVVPENHRDLIVCGALRWAYRLKREHEKAMVEDRRFEQMLSAAIRRVRDVSPAGGRIRPFDARSRARQADFSELALS